MRHGVELLMAYKPMHIRRRDLTIEYVTLGDCVLHRGFKIVEFEFRVRVRVSSNFLPLTSTKTVELPN